MKVVVALVAIALVSAWVRANVPAALLEVIGEHTPTVLVAVGVLTVLALAGRARARAAMIGHAHGGTSQFIGRHEAGHYHVARATGFGGLRVEADRHGGSVYASRAPKDPVARIATFRAGQYAVGSTAGCSYDREQVRRIVRGVPRADRARVLAEGEALSRRLVRQHRGAIKRDGKVIADTGRLR